MIAFNSISRCSLIGLASRGLPPLRKCCMSMSASAAPPVPPVPLADGALFRQQGFIDGEWCDADDGASLALALALALALTLTLALALALALALDLTLTQTQTQARTQAQT